MLNININFIITLDILEILCTTNVPLFHLKISAPHRNINIFSYFMDPKGGKVIHIPLLIAVIQLGENPLPFPPETF